MTTVDARGATSGTSEATPAARYVAMIADGNRRWAASRGLSAIDGYRVSGETALARVRDSIELGIRELTVFTFSSENWRRPPDEVKGLMSLAAHHIAKDTLGLARQGVQIRFIGARDELPTELTEQMRWAERVTASDPAIKLFLAFNYGGRNEIEDAARRFARREEQQFRDCLYAPDMHDPDLLIRTGGDRRLSNYMLWQLAYSELVFRDELWPEFTRECLEQCLSDFAARRRRVGG